jgi:Fur family ferric uptake transcriptional regulator
VYRHLKELQETGDLRAVELGSRDVRYEPADRPHHHHFACNACDRVFDIDGCPGHLEEMVPDGFALGSHDIVLHGRCRECSSEAAG